MPVPESRRAAAPCVLLVTASLEAGGSERQLADMANFWVSRGLRIVMASWSGAGVADFYRLDPRVRRAHLDGPRANGPLATLTATFGRIRRLRRLIAAERPDAVISFITENNVLTLLAGTGSNARLIVSERAHPALDLNVSRVWRGLRKLLYSRADVVVAQTRQTAAWIEQHCHAKAVVVPNGLRELHDSQIPKESLIVGVGRLVPQKGFDLLLEAFARIAARFPDWKVVIVGEGGEREALERQRDALGLAGRVTLPGHSGAVESWMARAGLVVQPSRFEGFPNVVLEAMGLGAAVVSADCLAGPSDLIDDGANGRLVPVENVPALAAAMADLMAQPDERARLGRAATAVRERFRQERIMSLWNDCVMPEVRREEH